MEYENACFQGLMNREDGLKESHFLGSWLTLKWLEMCAEGLVSRRWNRDRFVRCSGNSGIERILQERRSRGWRGNKGSFSHIFYCRQCRDLEEQR